MDSWSKNDYSPFIINNFFLFFTTSLRGTAITLSSNSWWVGWLGMEINLLGFIILLINNNSNERALKYFVIQSLSSVILISAALLTENFSIKKISILLNLALFLKLGTAPLHFWLPIIVENIRKYQLIFLLTWQKLAPLYLLFSLPWHNINYFFILSRLIIGAAGSINELRISTLITYSSINHTGWIILTLICNELIRLLYIFMYTLLILAFILPVNNKQNQTVWFLKNKNKYIQLLNLLSLGGLPPFTGFIIKWILITEIYQTLYIIINVIIILTRIILLYFYLRVCTNAFFKNQVYKLYSKKNKLENIIIFRIINLSGISLIILCIISIFKYTQLLSGKWFSLYYK